MAQAPGLARSEEKGFGLWFVASPGGSGLANKLTKEDKALNFILIDGTWSNSAAMFRRLQWRSRRGK
ncbi:hypothetical protein K1719_040477 [Acacia pycnantha]|nr:hypothetical protein K1719_040477 [Acacia pycnantha]